MNLTLSERCLGYLAVWSLDDAEEATRIHKLGGRGADTVLTEQLAEVQNDGRAEVLDVVLSALEDNFISAIAMAVFAFRLGKECHLIEANEMLNTGVSCCARLNLVNQWWCNRLAASLLKYMWNSSLHKQLPEHPLNISNTEWVHLRKLFIASHFRHPRVDIALCPSQIDAKDILFSSNKNFVISMPHDTGRMRISELLILTTVAKGKRAIYVAQNQTQENRAEVRLKRTFSAIGKSVINLRELIANGCLDEMLTRNEDIVVSTPERFDFLIRNEPTIVDDIALVVWDVGLVGDIEKEQIEAEIQIQRLLGRSDANTRRIIYFSSVYSKDDEISELTEWLTGNSAKETFRRMDWRRSRLRFGEVYWGHNRARLEFAVGDQRAIVSSFFQGVRPLLGARIRTFPSDQTEFCLATAWSLVEDGQTVLIYCPIARSLEFAARAIVNLQRGGALKPLLQQQTKTIQRALAVGEDSLGSESAFLNCLRLGVVVYDDALPLAYRRLLDQLLNEGVIRVTVISDALLKGVQASASVVVFYSLRRKQGLMRPAEFWEVVARAGRPCMDVEGQALYPIFTGAESRQKDWQTLINEQESVPYESGLFLLLDRLLDRIIGKYRPFQVSTFFRYVSSSAYWEFPQLKGEDDDELRKQKHLWRTDLSTLDVAILGLLGYEDLTSEQLVDRIDQVLKSSLCVRYLAKQRAKVQRIINLGFLGRALVIIGETTSRQRKAYFRARLGLEAGKFLDDNIRKLRELLITAQNSISCGSQKNSITAIIEFAELVFSVHPFTPNLILKNWKDVLKSWLNGQEILTDNWTTYRDDMRFIEDGLIDKLSRAIEAVQMHDSYETGENPSSERVETTVVDLVVRAIESGTLSIPASILIKAGFGSRSIAIKATSDGNADFSDVAGLMNWIDSDPVVELGRNPDWPTPESHELWKSFVSTLHSAPDLAWEVAKKSVPVEWVDESPKLTGMAVRVYPKKVGCDILSSSFDLLGKADVDLSWAEPGSLHATVFDDPAMIEVNYAGPKMPDPRTGFMRIRAIVNAQTERS